MRADTGTPFRLQEERITNTLLGYTLQITQLLRYVTLQRSHGALEGDRFETVKITKHPDVIGDFSQAVSAQDPKSEAGTA
jgi:hypothetical protein